jgi:hypothetical protein
MSDEALSVEDRLEILELLARADDAASNRDIETYITLFTDDADLQGIKGVHRGKDALRAGAPGVVCKVNGDWLIRRRVVEHL